MRVESMASRSVGTGGRAQTPSTCPRAVGARPQGNRPIAATPGCVVLTAQACRTQPRGPTGYPEPATLSPCSARHCWTCAALSGPAQDWPGPLHRPPPHLDGKLGGPRRVLSPRGSSSERPRGHWLGSPPEDASAGQRRDGRGPHAHVPPRAQLASPHPAWAATATLSRGGQAGTRVTIKAT